MAHLTIKDLTIQLDLESKEETFDWFSQAIEANLKVTAAANFRILRKDAQGTILNHFSETNDNAYQFLHSLI